MGKTVKKIRTEGVSHSYSAKNPTNLFFCQAMSLTIGWKQKKDLVFSCLRQVKRGTGCEF
jgi:hypothetical protein